MSSTRGRKTESSRPRRAPGDGEAPDREPEVAGPVRDRRGLLQTLLAAHVARSARRVLERREAARSGSKGGETGSPLPGTAGRAAPAVSRPAAGGDGSSPARRTDERRRGESRSRGEEPEPAEPARPAGAAAADPGHPLGGEGSLPLRIWNVARGAFLEFGRDNGSLMAASVAFYVLLSLVPLLLVAISIFGFVLGNDVDAQRQVMAFLSQFLPGQNGQQLIAGAVESVIRVRGVVGGIGLVGLLFSGIQGLATLESAIDVIWGAPRRSFLWNKAFALVMLIVIGALFLLSLSITTLVQWAREIPALDWVARNWGLQLLGIALPIVLTGSMFTLIYKWFPNVETRWKPAVLAGFSTGALWELLKHAYTYYSRQVDQAATYGSLGGLVGLILWIYYSAALVLLGAEVAWVLSGCPGREWKKPEPPGEG